MTGQSDNGNIVSGPDQIPLNYWLAGVVALLFAAAFSLTFVDLIEKWYLPDSYYSHGVLIPFISIWLIWRKRDQLAGLKNEPARNGLFLVVPALIMHVLSVAMLLVLIGTLAYIRGWAIVRLFWFPIVFLLYMMPPPSMLILKVVFEMKMFACRSGSFVVNIFNIPVAHEGSKMHLPNATLIIGDTCSGLRSLIALTAMGALFAYLSSGSVNRKTLFFLFSFPIAIFANVVRVIAICLVAYFWGEDIAEHAFHDISGYLVFVIAFICLYLTGVALGCLRLTGGSSSSPSSSS